MSSVFVTSGRSQFCGFGDPLTDVASWDLTGGGGSTDQGQAAVDQAQAQVVAAAFNDFLGQMNAAKADVQRVDGLLYSTVASMSSYSLTNAKANAQNLVDTWHSNALNWMNEATQIVADVQNDLAAGDPTIANDEVNNWITSGQILASTASNILSSIGGQASAGEISLSNVLDAWQTLCNGAAQAGVAAAQAAGQIAGAAGAAAGGALLSTLTPLLFAGAGIALLLVLLDQSSGGRAAVRVGEKAALAGHGR